ncbi:cyclin-dependent kinase 2-associated protein 1 isoform X1 [Callithrix jacchus]
MLSLTGPQRQCSEVAMEPVPCPVAGSLAVPHQAVLALEQQMRAHERDLLKKWQLREARQRHCLEGQCHIPAIRLQCWDRREAREACRRCRGEAKQPDWDEARRTEREARGQRRPCRREEARALLRELAQLWEEAAEEQAAWAFRPSGSLASLIQGTGNSQVPQSKYAELLAIIEELGKEIRPTYAGSKSAMERLKRGIIHARGLVRECLAETERNARS